MMEPGKPHKLTPATFVKAAAQSPRFGGKKWCLYPDRQSPGSRNARGTRHIALALLGKYYLLRGATKRLQHPSRKKKKIIPT